MTETKVFLDSSVWLGYFLGNLPNTKQIVDAEETILFTSIITIHEVFKKIKKTCSEKSAKEAIQFIEDNSIIVNLDKDIAIKAVNNCEKYSLHAIDSLIYTSSINANTLFVTADFDFKNMPRTLILRQ